MTKKTINVNGIDISVLENNYISLTDLAKTRSSESPKDVIKAWMHNRETLGYLKEWELLNNKDFKGVQAHPFKGYEAIEKEYMQNPWVMYPSKWMQYTNGTAFIVKLGRYGGTWGHSDVALSFASWLSPKFHLYVNMEFQRLKEDELARLGDPFNMKRHLVSGNFQLMAQEVLNKMDERLLTHPQPYKSRLPFASEADLLNKIVFGKTAKEWRLQHPKAPKDRNQRDFANLIELAVLNNLEFLNALFLRWEMSREEREPILKEVAKWLTQSFNSFSTMQKLQKFADKFKK